MQKAQVIKATHRRLERNQGCPVVLSSQLQSDTHVLPHGSVNPTVAVVAQQCFSVSGSSLSVQRLSEV